MSEFDDPLDRERELSRQEDEQFASYETDRASYRKFRAVAVASLVAYPIILGVTNNLLPSGNIF